MTASVEQLCDLIAQHRLLPSAELSRLRARWFQPKRLDVNDVEKFGQWLAVNGFLTAFTFRMLRDGKANLLQLNQYQLTDHLTSGPFAGAYLANDPLQRQVVIELLAPQRASSPEAVRAFQQAAQQAMTVRSPNVNLTLDFGEAKGQHYLVRELDKGETLADILAQRGRVHPVTAARLFALALVGLQALHEKQVPAGPLGVESLLVSAPRSSAGGKSRTVKILHAGVPRGQLDPGTLDPLFAAAPHVGAAREDLFRLGIALYRSLTGQQPFPDALSGAGSHRATPLRQVVPEVPEMLAGLVEAMIDPEPAHRPASAAQVAKSLRVFLASEEEATPVRPEEQVAAPAPAPVSPAAQEPAEEEAEAPASSEGEEAEQPAAGKQWPQSLKGLWDELRPSDRDMVFFSIGVAAVILVVLFLKLVTGIGFVNIICLLAGGAVSFFIERLLRMREEEPASRHSRE
jgi:hypothetical protein